MKCVSYGRRIAFAVLGFFLSVLIYEFFSFLAYMFVGPIGLTYFLGIPIVGAILNSAFVYVFERKKDRLLERIEAKELEIHDLKREVERIRKHLRMK